MNTVTCIRVKTKKKKLIIVNPCSTGWVGHNSVNLTQLKELFSLEKFLHFTEEHQKHSETSVCVMTQWDPGTRHSGPKTSVCVMDQWDPSTRHSDPTAYGDHPGDGRRRRGSGENTVTKGKSPYQR